MGATVSGSSIEVSKLAAFVTRYKTLVVVLALLVTCGMGVGISRIQTEVILSDLFPQDHPYLDLMEKFSKIFGGFGAGVIIGVKAEEEKSSGGGLAGGSNGFGDSHRAAGGAGHKDPFGGKPFLV